MVAGVKGKIIAPATANQQSINMLSRGDRSVCKIGNYAIEPPTMSSNSFVMAC